VGMLAFFGDMAVRPTSWAAEVSRVMGPAVHGATASVAGMLG
jgi:hypothetical protein